MQIFLGVSSLALVLRGDADRDVDGRDFPLCNNKLIVRGVCLQKLFQFLNRALLPLLLWCYLLCPYNNGVVPKLAERAASTTVGERASLTAYRSMAASQDAGRNQRLWTLECLPLDRNP